MHVNHALCTTMKLTVELVSETSAPPRAITGTSGGPTSGITAGRGGPTSGNTVKPDLSPRGYRARATVHATCGSALL